MKTYRHLYPQICSFANLYLAFRRARLGKRKKENVADFEYDLEANLWKLHEELVSQTYRPGPYHNFYITEPKRRLVSAAPFRDRVVHHALCNVIEPIFETRFIHDSYACRIGKGTHRALARCTEFVRKNKYVLKGDIQKFFPSVDHQILRGLLARYIADEKVLHLIDLILASGEGILANEYEMQWIYGDDLWAAFRPRGLPIGNLTSQFWANVVLNELDQFVKRELRCRYYIRYVDDFLLFSDDKRELHYWKEKISRFLETLRLKMHERKSVVFPVRMGVDFLGFRTFPTHRWILKSSVRRFIERLKKMHKGYLRGEVELEQMNRSVQSWVAHSRYGDTYGLRRSIFATITFDREVIR